MSGIRAMWIGGLTIDALSAAMSARRRTRGAGWSGLGELGAVFHLISIVGYPYPLFFDVESTFLRVFATKSLEALLLGSAHVVMVYRVPRLFHG